MHKTTLAHWGIALVVVSTLACSSSTTTNVTLSDDGGVGGSTAKGGTSGGAGSGGANVGDNSGIGGATTGTSGFGSGGLGGSTSTWISSSSGQLGITTSTTSNNGGASGGTDVGGAAASGGVGVGGASSAFNGTPTGGVPGVGGAPTGGVPGVGGAPTGGVPGVGGATSSGAGGTATSGGATGSAADASLDCTHCDPKALATSTRFVALTGQSPILYYVESVGDAGNAGPLMRISMTGSAPAAVTLAPSDVTQLLADGSYVYGSGYTINRVSVLGGTNFASIQGAPSYGPRIRTNGTHVFGMWGLSQQHVTRVLKAGGTAETPASTPLFDWVDFDVDDAYVYLATKTTVTKVPVAGGDVVILAAADSGESFRELRSANDQLLVVTSDKRVATIQKAGGGPSTLSSGNGYGLAVDGQFAYFFRAQPGGGETCATGSDLYEVALASGVARHLAFDAGGCAIDVVQDSSGVYWISGDRRSILSANE